MSQDSKFKVDQDPDDDFQEEDCVDGREHHDVHGNVCRQDDSDFRACLHMVAIV